MTPPSRALVRALTRAMDTGAAPAPDAPAPDCRRAVRFGAGAAALFFGGLALWSAAAPLASAALAPGEVRVDGHRKTVQHLEGGIVRDILVREGETVRAGATLLRLDTTQSAATRDALAGQHDALLAAEARLRAERDGAAAVLFPSELVQRRGDPRVDELVAGQTAIFLERRRALAGQIDVLQEKRAQLAAERDGAEAQLAAHEAQIALIEDEIRTVEALVKKGLEKRPRLLALQRQAALLAGNRGQHKGAVQKAEKAIRESELQIAEIETARASAIATELREIQTKRAELAERLAAAADVAARTEVKAPEDGRVLNLRHVTPGGVVKPGESILDLVPSDDRLVVEARVAPTDIDTVRTGLAAEVRLLAYKQRRTPPVPGTVTQVAADSLVDERSGAAYYLTRIEIDPEALRRIDGVRLYPGMPAEVAIVTGARTALGYLTDPVRTSFQRAFLED